MNKEGGTVKIQDLEGHHIAVYFSAHWSVAASMFFFLSFVVYFQFFVIQGFVSAKRFECSHIVMS